MSEDELGDWKQSEDTPENEYDTTEDYSVGETYPTILIFQNIFWCKYSTDINGHVPPEIVPQIDSQQDLSSRILWVKRRIKLPGYH